jgi:drug/metabolite transporter (DMT)-like permease
MITGILFGLAAAFFQSCSYLFSKRYVARFEQTTVGLLVCGHAVMGVFSLVLLPFFMPMNTQTGIPGAMAGFQRYVFPLTGCVIFYLLGQVFLFRSFKDTDASRVSPLLGIKIFMLAGLAIIFTNQHFHALQWGGIMLSVVAACMLGMMGKKLSLKSWGWIFCACLCYSLSDLSIKVLIGRFAYLGLFRASVVSTCLNYLFCGIAAGAALLFLPVFSFSKWRTSFPFAVSWFTGILFLFLCFGSVGVVFGNIVQSTRGLASILIGSLVAYKGYEHIEEKVTPHATLMRLFAGTLMIAAIALFYLGE